MNRKKKKFFFFFFSFMIMNYLLRARIRSVVRLRYLSRSMTNNRSRRLARHIRLVVFYRKKERKTYNIDEKLLHTDF